MDDLDIVHTRGGVARRIHPPKVVSRWLNPSRETGLGRLADREPLKLFHKKAQGLQPP